MSDIKLNSSLERQIYTQISSDILKSGNLKADVYFKNINNENKKVKLRVIIWNGDTIKDEDVPDVYKNWIPYSIDNIEILENVNNKKKGNMIMKEKQNATKFIKNLMDDDYAEANKSLVNMVNLKIQDRIKNEIITQEKEK